MFVERRMEKKSAGAIPVILQLSAVKERILPIFCKQLCICNVSEKKERKYHACQKSFLKEFSVWGESEFCSFK